MSTHLPTRRTLAVAVALRLTSTGAAALSAMAAGTTTKPIKIAPSAAPQILDRPGTGRDVVRLTNLPGIRWSVTGDVDASYKAPFATSEKFVDVPINNGGVTAVVKATASPGVELATDVVSWTLPFITTKVAITAPEAPRAQDFPETAKDAVQLTAVEGVTWSVKESVPADTSIPAFKGVKSFPLSKLKVPASTATVTVTPTVEPGYDGTALQPYTLAFTNGKIVDLPTAVIDAAVTDQLNLPGRSRDTITLLPVTGVKWSICGSKPFAVSKPVVKSASCRTQDVETTAIPDAGYSIAGAKSFTKTVKFEDAAGQNLITIPADAVTPVDAAGSVNDVVLIKPIRNITWQVATPVPAKDGGEPTWKWANAPKPKNGQAIVVKMKAAKGASESTLFVRPVAVTDDFAWSGWVGSGTSAKDDGQTFTTKTDLGELSITAGNAPTFAANKDVTLNRIDGVPSWTVVRTTTTATDKVKDVKSVIKVAPYSAVVVPANTATKVIVTPMVDKNYTLTGTKSWDSTGAPSTTTTPTDTTTTSAPAPTSAPTDAPIPEPTQTDSPTAEPTPTP